MAKTAREIIEIVTAILLGLVSVATAFGAYQASVLAGEASQYASVSQQLRDRNLTEALTTQLIFRDDGRKMVEVIGLDQEMLLFPERTADLLEQQRVLIESATPELGAAWDAWVAADNDPELFPLSAPSYEAALFATTQSMQHVSFVADDLSDAVGEKSGQLVVGSVVFAVALLLLGVAGVNQAWRVALGFVGAATVAFLAGLVVLLAAIF